MAEIFAHSGENSDNVGVPAPRLQGIFLPGIDVPDLQDGFGLITPLGGGATSRQYTQYGISNIISPQETQLHDLAIPSAEGNVFNFEGLIGPQGIPGPPGAPGLIQVIVAPNSSFLTALPHNIDEINTLGTAADKMIYTSAYTAYDAIVWTETQPDGDQDGNWFDIASDSDGSNLVVAKYNDYLFTSDDSGETWTERQPAGAITKTWGWVASDSDGSFLLTGVRVSGGVYYSANSGVDWTKTSLIDSANWRCGACDSDGSNLIVGGTNFVIYTSSDYGSNWTDRDPPTGGSFHNWEAVASDSDGSHLAAAINPGRLYTSANAGVSWTERQPAGNANKFWTFIAMSSDGSKIMVGADSERIYLSVDYGVNWSEIRPKGDTTGQWRDGAMSSDGTVLIVGEAFGLYTSTDSGATWTEEDPAGSDPFNAVDVDSDGSNFIVREDNRLYTGVTTELYSEATWGEAALTSAGRALIDDATVAAQNTTLGFGLGDSPTLTGLTLTAIAAEIADVDKFLVDSSGVIKFRTGAELLSDIGGITSDEKVKIDSGATAGYLGAASSDGVLRTGNSLSYTDGGDFVTLDAIQDIQTSATPQFTGIEIGHVSDTTLIRVSAGDLSIEGNIIYRAGGTDVPVVDGGTGIGSLTDHGILLGSGTSAITPLGVASNGQIPIGSAGADPVLALITGTANQIISTPAAGTITLSTPQDIHTGASNFTVVGLTVSDLTQGSVIFAGAGGVISQDNSNVFWDNLNKRLGIGINTGFDPRTGITISGDIDILHTATEADDHAFEIDVDAATLGDVKAIDIVYTTGILTAGKDEGIILINIDETLATGGEIFGLEVLATDGLAEIFGMKVGAVIGPIHQDSGTFANPTLATDNTPTTDVPVMRDGILGNTTTIFEAQNEYIIIGAATAFEEIEFILATPTSNPGIKPTFWYSSAAGGGFTQFTPVDGTNGFRNTGVVAWDASDLVGHIVGGVTGTFDIKIIRTKAGSLSPSPVLGYAKTAETVEYEWDKNGDVSIRGLTVAGNSVFGLNSSVFQPIADSTTFFQVLDANGGTPIFNVDSTNERVGIGTATIPHGGVGYAKFAIDGASGDVAGPHVQFTTSSDNYPLMQILNWRHDDISIRFDSYWDGANKSSDVGSNYAIFKVSDSFKIMYDSGVTKGGAVTWNEGIVLNTSGLVTFGGAINITTVAAEGSDVDKFLVDSSGIVKYRTGTQVLSDIDASASGHNHSGVYEPADAGLTSLAALSYVSASFVKMTGANAFALRTIGQTADDLEGTIDHDNLANGGAHDYAYISGNDGATGVTAAELEELSDGSETTLHSHAGGGGDVSKQFLEVMG